jgi:hypothetical protein
MESAAIHYAHLLLFAGFIQVEKSEPDLVGKILQLPIWKRLFPS